MLLNETMTWGIVLFLLVMSLFLDSRFTVLAVFWILKLMITGNARRLYFEQYESVVCYIRRLLYPLSCLLPVFLLDDSIWKTDICVIIWSMIALMIGFLFLLPKYREWSLFLSKDMIMLGRKKEKYDYISQSLLLAIGAAAEEIFYRGFVIGFMVDYVPHAVLVLTSCLLFFGHHFSVKWNSKFKIYDYVIQILFAAVSSVIFLCSGSVIPCIAAHLAYNSVFIFLEMKSYSVFYKM